MGNFLSNEFPVKGRVVVITGGSRGTGLAAGRILAAKGANVVIVARRQDKLLEGVRHIQKGALNPEIQRFHQISADLASPSESIRVIDEVLLWNSGNPPDIVWCCAGSSHPTLFIDTPVSQFHSEMDNNYFTSMHMAHATLRCWLRTSRPDVGSPSIAINNSATQSSRVVPARHLIFTASFLAFYSFAGYSPYSPSKAALRSLSDTLSQEMNLYAAAYPNEPHVRVHTIFPATIFTESYEAENIIKSDLTKMLEEGDAGQTPEVVAEKSIKALEIGQEIITTDILSTLVKRSVLGGSIRGGFWMAIGDWFLACALSIVMVFVRHDMDRRVRKWGRKFGASGMKSGHKRA
ncbi:NAD(P)-binding protein [Annulohypoxylon maeteangense]|uniref:NAD(P)-binding protein n=1 Tax=Annulohypoxylon maeteangense TaxID=1927788 RepID=UPI0020087514|nr:NAD(P)-binding protein [Annulohypoxylon maeteangense]KAI0880337.1 NAD(P)-binding protein [Annulohypoxylon maeteangense]